VEAKCKTCHGTDMTSEGIAGVSCGSLNGCHHEWTTTSDGTHGAIYNDDKASCQTCHGSDLAGGDTQISCGTGNECHHTFVIPIPDNNNEHGLAYSDDKELCRSCHGNDLTGGDSQISCGSGNECHHSWGIPSDPQHGAAFINSADFCKACHGSDLQGGDSQKSCLTCHHDNNWDGTSHGAEFSNTRETCKACHGDYVEGGLAGYSCFSCHRHENINNCSECHTNSSLSHTTHKITNNRGPDPLDCEDCHKKRSGEQYEHPYFADNNYFDNTSVCNNCHSQNGAYDGVNDPVIGAKSNWSNGVYTDDLLTSGKEKWCVGCHDDTPANSSIDGSGVSAQNIAGDDTIYGFYSNGHGRSSANIECLDCHDATKVHIDEDPRTYAFDSAYYAPTESGVAYAEGYRLKNVNGEVPLMIPANYGTTFGYDAGLMRDTAFRLCFQSGCHDSSKIFDATPGDGLSSNFKASLPNPPRNYSYAWGSGADTNEHVTHIMNYTGPFCDSDWDTGTTGPGGSGGRDSLMACSSCHNIHGVAGIEGSTNEVMIRDGSLTGRTGYGFSYVVEDTGAGGYPWVTSTGANQANSIGAIFRYNSSDMCGGSMCHGDPTPPTGSSYDASGSSWGTYLEYYRTWTDYSGD
ncbi:MAG: hypothetical protein SVR08_05020, partial [Spirochaetota bacterium]|nr:hypothetical protein [Spirochaetota bacterium]